MSYLARESLLWAAAITCLVGAYSPRLAWLATGCGVAFYIWMTTGVIT